MLLAQLLLLLSLFLWVEFLMSPPNLVTIRGCEKLERHQNFNLESEYNFQVLTKRQQVKLDFIIDQSADYSIE